MVLAVIGVVSGIAFSYFNQSEGDANDIAAQQLARSTATSLETMFKNRGVWVTDTTQLTSLIPDRVFVAGATVNPFDVSVASSGLSVGVAVQSPSGSCFTIKVTDQVTSMVEATDKFTISPQAVCSGATALLAAAGVSAW